jgi:hypothetical protein
MAQHISTTYTCERCGCKLKTCRNSMAIVTSLKESAWWSRLHVQILHIHGIDNSSEVEQAELCQSCTIWLLSDALERVRKGERATKGTEASVQRNWDE